MKNLKESVQHSQDMYKKPLTVLNFSNYKQYFKQLYKLYYCSVLQETNVYIIIIKNLSIQQSHLVYCTTHTDSVYQ